jgi:hypothetical protein
LRELVEATAQTIDPDAVWWPANGLEHAEPREQRAGVMLEQLRARAVRDPVIAADAITGQQLDRPPASHTYLQVQRYAGPPRQFGPRRSTPTRSSTAAAVASRHAREPASRTVYGALTWLALDRPLPSPQDANATLLLGSRIVICGSGGHHRTLACFLWGAGKLTGTITVVNELADDELHAACRLIDSRLPNPTRVDVVSGGHAARRARLLELAERLKPLRPLSTRDLRTQAPGLDDISYALDSMGSLRRVWLRQPFRHP